MKKGTYMYKLLKGKVLIIMTFIFEFSLTLWF